MRNGYNEIMIKSFADKETEKVYNQLFSKKLPQSIQKIALRKLIMIDNAGCLEDLRVPPANQLELLKGDRAGQYSIRINGQYRVCFNVDGNMFFQCRNCRLSLVQTAHNMQGEENFNDRLY